MVALGVAELVLRSTGLVSARGLHTVDLAEFDAIPGMFSPGQDLIDERIPELPYRVTTNRLGYRGPELVAGKSPGERRILFIGDSFTFGDFVEDDETVPARVESRLATQCRSIRTVNAGLGGSTIVAHAAITERARALEPDLVVLMFYENDVIDLRRPIWHDLEANRIAKSRFPARLVYRATRDLALWNLALRARAALQARERSVTAPTGAEPDTSDFPALRDTYRRHLTALRDALEERGIPLVVTAFPSHLTVYREWTVDHIGWLRGITTAAGIEYVDLLEPLRSLAAAPEELYLLPHDAHATPRASDFVAGILSAHLADLPTLGCP